MAVLGETDRVSCWAELMQQESNARNPVGITKADLRAAIGAADDWIEANAAAYNSAIPQPARSTLTSRQKALLLATLALKRYGVT